MYYLNSRFYNQEIGRFINADNFELILASKTALTDKNLYAYCDNNPIVRVDHEGEFWEAIGIGFVAGVIGQYVADIIGNVKNGEKGFDVLKPTSSVRDYFASGIGGAIAAHPNLGLFNTMVVGALGNVVSDGLKGNIKNVCDLGKSIAWGAGANGLGYLAAKGLAIIKIKNIDDMSRTIQKNYLNDNIYKSSRASINTNYHAYMSNSLTGKICIIEKSFIGFRSGVYSTFTSTAASLLR